ncbi:MAG: N-acetylmuramoyl-L-alanine amidase [Candidatus Woesearchaeota archaeon]|jgi:N-acetylmuramoyl-L-alanine amidase|nr:N-acetylmuramoyl-L-alanine amidase [Candidatus Woesearchaeota archaeon]
MNIQNMEVIILILLLGGGSFYMYTIFQHEEEFVPEPQVALEEEERIDLYTCQGVDTSDPEWKDKTILLDPGHMLFDGDEGFSNASNGFSESTMVREIAQSLSFSGSNFLGTRSLEKEEVASTNDRVQRILAQNPALIISFHVGEGENTLNAFVSSTSENIQESRKLACNIINAIIQNDELHNGNIEIEGRNVISLNPKFYNENDPEFILRTKKPAVLLEMGSINIARNENFLTSKLELGEAIYKGIGDYYE